MKLAGIGRFVLVVAVVFGAAWLCAIAYWRGSNAMPGGGQMLLFLGVLPLALLGGIWLVRRVRGSCGAAPTRAKAVAVAASAGDKDEAEAAPPMECLASELYLPCGDDAMQVLALLPAPPRPRLHPGFRDRDGFPVLAAHVDGLRVDGVVATLGGSRDMAQWIAQAGERARALALLEPVATALFDHAARLLPPLPAAAERVVAGLRHTNAPGARVAVRVHALLPASWGGPLRQQIGDWLLGQAVAAGIDGRRIALDAVAADGPDATWRLLDAIDADAGGGDAWHLLLACDSLVGERSVQQLEASGRLMDSRRTEGLVPGEGAAGVLLRFPDGPVPADPAQAVALHRAVRATLPPGSQPRAAARASGELLSLALRRAGHGAETVALVLSDADQRSSRVVEASIAAAAACPDLDVATQCAAIGVPCGETGPVSPLALLALAAAQVQASGQPALVFSFATAGDRVAAVVAPIATSPPSPGQAGVAPPAAT